MIKLHFDFRSKIAVLMFTMLLVAVLKSNISIYVLFGFLTVYLVLQGYIRKALSLLSIAIIATILKIVSMGQGISVLVPDMLLFIITRVMLMLMAAQPIIGMPPGEVVASFKKIHVGNFLALPVTFMLRFIPTVKSEFASVFAAMRLRGLISFKRPLRTLEYILVPVMIRASKISDELAASSEVRGIVYPGVHTCRRDISFKKKDWLLCVVGVIITTFLIVRDKVVII